MRARIGIVAGLILSTCFVYAQVRGFGTLSLDDGLYYAGNPHVLAGLTLDGLRWALTTELTSNWHPLTWLSLMLDVQLFGVNPAASHMVNLGLHVLNTLGVFVLFERMTKSLWRSAFVAALFGLHPMHVESVAWLSERKDVLSAFFFLCATGAYLRWVVRSSRPAWIAALALFALGLCAKPMIVTWPLAMLLLDVWPLRRIAPEELGKPARVWPLLREKLPFLALSLASSLLTASRGAYWEFVSLPQRLANAPVSYVRYLEKLFWPVDQAMFYPHPLDWPAWQVAACVAVLLALSAGALALLRRRPYLLTGWLFFLGTLVPAIGLVQVGWQSMADRYVYLPMLGIAWIVAWGVPDLLPRRANTPALLTALALTVLGALGVATQRYVGFWRDEETLFLRALAVTHDNWPIHFYHGENLLQDGRFEEALEHLGKAARMKHDDPRVHHLHGIALARLGRRDEAMAAWQAALRLRQGFWPAAIDLADAYASLGNPKLAIFGYRMALAGQPQNRIARQKLAALLATWPEGTPADRAEAVTLLEQLVRERSPAQASELEALARAYEAAGRAADAERVRSQAAPRKR